MNILVWTLICFAMAGTAMCGPRKLFLSIGINRYDDPYWHTLNFASKDAADIAEALKEKFDGGVLLNDSEATDSRVQRDRILHELDRLVQENRDEQDVILVYISAHGTIARKADESLEKFVLTADSRPQNLLRTAISHADLFKRFRSLKSRRKVLILDSCYSGEGKSRLSETMLKQLAQSKGAFFKEPEPDVDESTMILTASAWGEEALESKDFKNGFYTHFLIKGFDRDYNEDGAVTITEAHQYATQKVIESTRSRQHPTARIEMVGQDPIVIRGSRSSGSPLLFAYDWLAQKLDVEINGRKIGNLSRGALLVPEGKQQLVLRNENGDVLFNRHVKFENGHEYPLSQYMYEDPAWSLKAAAWFGSLLNGGKSNRVLPQQMNGWQLALQKEEALRDLDLEFQAMILGDTRNTIDSDDIDVKQSLSGYRLASLIGRHHRIGPRASRDWSGYLSWKTGLSLMSLRRRVQDSSFIEPHQESLAPGVAAAVELGMESLASRIQLSLRLGSEVYRSHWELGSNLQVFATTEAAAGYIW